MSAGGFLQFANVSEIGSVAPIAAPDWPVRSAAAAIYYAEHA
jgi:hypothetical protein